MPDQFTRTERLLGSEGLDMLAHARVAVFGLGGVGGHAAEALARSGVGAIDLVDHDTICESNLNRQVIALHSTIGQSKAQAMAARVRDINPACAVTAHERFFDESTRAYFDFTRYDYVVDAIDTVTSKLLLAEICCELRIRIISCMGTGNKLDPTRLEIADIYGTSVCPLAKVMRHELRRRGIPGLKVLYSREEPAGHHRPPGSTAFVPSVAGLIIAGEVVRELIRGNADGD